MYIFIYITDILEKVAKVFEILKTSQELILWLYSILTSIASTIVAYFFKLKPDIDYYNKAKHHQNHPHIHTKLQAKESTPINIKHDSFPRLVNLPEQIINLGFKEITYSLFFGVFLSGINIIQRVIQSGSTPKSEQYSLEDVIILNVTMGISAFFLTAIVFLYFSYENDNISLFIKGIGSQIFSSYLAGIAIIEVISHFDTFEKLRSPQLMMVFCHLMFIMVSFIETYIDLLIAGCFRKLDNHYKEFADIYENASKNALRSLVFNLALSSIAIFANLKKIPEISSLYTLVPMVLFNLYCLVSIRLKLFKASVEGKYV